MGVILGAFPGLTWVPEWLVVVVVAYPILVYFSIQKDLDALAFVSLIKAAVVSVTVLVVIVLFNCSITTEFQSITGKSWDEDTLNALLVDSADVKYKNKDEYPWKDAVFD